MIYRVPTERVSDIWPEVEGLLRPVIDLPACRCTLAGTYLKLRTGQRQLFVAMEQGTIVAAGVTCITSYDVGDWVTIILCGGKEMDSWAEESIEAVEEFARQCGCMGVEIIGRDGWARVHGYERTASMIQKELQ